MSFTDSVIKKYERFQTEIKHFVQAIWKHYEAIDFLLVHRLWNGIFNYGWISRALMILAIVLGFQYVKLLLNWSGSSANDGFNSSSFIALGSESISFWKERFGWIFSGGHKYLILILTEVITFHAVRSTIAIISGKSQDKSFNVFLKAQIRMVQVAVFSWVMSIVFTVIISTFLGLIGFSFLKPSLILVAECFFLGFALIDNYNEQYELKVKESYRRTLTTPGIAIGLGLVFYLLLFVPFLGALLAPSIGGVAAALLMLELEEKEEVKPYFAFITKEKK